MFDIIFFVSIVGIAFLTCAVFEVIAHRVLRHNKVSKEYASAAEMCDACGENPKAPDSQICKECQKIAYGD